MTRCVKHLRAEDETYVKVEPEPGRRQLYAPVELDDVTFVHEARGHGLLKSRLDMSYIEMFF